MCLSRHPVQCSFQTNGVTLKQTEKFKYFGVVFLSNGRQENELDARIGKASVVLRQLYQSLVLKRELLYKSKAFCFQISFCSYPHLWSSVLGNDQKSEIPSTGGQSVFFCKKSEVYRYLTRLKALTFVNLSANTITIALVWPCDTNVPRANSKTTDALPSGKRPRERPRTRWRNYVEDLAWSRLGIKPAKLLLVAGDRDTWRSQLDPQSLMDKPAKGNTLN